MTEGEKMIWAAAFVASLQIEFTELSKKMSGKKPFIVRGTGPTLRQCCESAAGAVRCLRESSQHMEESADTDPRDSTAGMLARMLTEV